MWWIAMMTRTHRVDDISMCSVTTKRIRKLDRKTSDGQGGATLRKKKGKFCKLHTCTSVFWINSIVESYEQNGKHNIIYFRHRNYNCTIWLRILIKNCQFYQIILFFAILYSFFLNLCSAQDFIMYVFLLNFYFKFPAGLGNKLWMAPL